MVEQWEKRSRPPLKISRSQIQYTECNESNSLSSASVSNDEMSNEYIESG
jgi:hypothetical protein